MKKRQLEHIEINGVNVPYYRAHKVTNEDGTESTTMPTYISALLKGNWVQARASACKEVFIHLARELGFETRVIEAPLAMSGNIPKGCFVFDGERIILNEVESQGRALDADGDRGALIQGNNDQYVLVKYPITSKPLILTRIYEPTKAGIGYPVPVTFQDLTKATFNKKWKDSLTPYDRADQVNRVCNEANIGLLTSAWATKELKEARYLEEPNRKHHIYGNPMRYQDIEVKGLKVGTKDYTYSGEKSVLEQTETIDPIYKPFVSPGSITRLPDECLWADLPTIKKVVDNVKKLWFEFVPIAPPPTGTGTTSEPTQPIYEESLIKRLTTLGLLRFVNLGHHRPETPSAVLIYLATPEGTPCAIAEVKRRHHESTNIAFAYILPPVWSCKEDRFMHPIEHLQEYMQSFDSRILNPETGQTVAFWPKNKQSLKQYPFKTADFQRALQHYCDHYGDVVPAEHFGSGAIPSQMAIYISKATVSIDFGDTLDPESMATKLIELEDKIGILACSAKGKHKDTRKVCITNGQGGAYWDKENLAHPRRSGCIRSQLIRAVKLDNPTNPKHPELTQMRVAIVRNETEYQTLITPSGIEKQQSSHCFLNGVLNTEEEWNDYRENVLEDGSAPILRTTIFTTWAGLKRKAWLTNPKRAIRIGKLADWYGMKFQPRAFEHKVLDKNGGNIDLLIPMEEVIAKGAHKVYLKNTTQETITINGTKIKALVGTFTFCRTGSQSENTPVRHRPTTYKGLDGVAIATAVQQITQIPEKTEDWTFPTELLSSIEKLG